MSYLDKEYDYYLANKAELAQKYDGKFLVIKGQEIIGVHDSDLGALIETSRKHEVGTFLIQECASGDESHTQTFHSRFVID